MISVRAGLSPPPAPVAPGAFDYARQLYFQRIGAVGFAVTAPEVVEDAEKTAGQRLAAAIETIRFGLFKRITSAATEEGGGGLAVFNRRREKFAAKIWKETVGFVPEETQTIPMRNVYQCDASGCVGEFGRDAKALAAFVENRAALGEDCARADLVVAFFPVSAEDWRACDVYLIDRRSAWRCGTHSARVDENGDLIVRNSAAFRGRRPWTGD